MASLIPQEAVRLSPLRMRWCRLAFVHWPFEPAAVQRLLPSGLLVEEYDGRAWVGLTPFVMTDIRPAGMPAVPAARRLATLLETNLRTYVRGPDGRDGLWFLSVHASGAVVSMMARASTGAPYHLGDLSVTEHGGVLACAGSRRGGEPFYQLRIRPGDPIDPSDFDVWLTTRWRVYTRRCGMLLRTPVWHEPWPLCTASVEELAETVTSAAGLPRPAAEPIAHYTPGAGHVRIGLPRPAAARH
ncbi:YqjF family protein [Streptomyces sp. YIM 98790]|uniref:YqjF family protein n=1 Tax=Streptomyces sp. YIM 98790 TaxID=2689077 RepID=UPI00140C2485|nr:DUF2071 domain-containing protein [Streptomyces sp. YIM 98790]